MSRKKSFTILLCMALTFPIGTRADQKRPHLVKVQNHAGQMDTDGILSPGEIPNPNIDYDRAQRQHERHGDARVDNPYNDQAAEESQDYKDRIRGRYEWDNDRRYKDEGLDEDRHYRDDGYDRDSDDRHYYPWWRW